jgi:ubiquitin C-terminal hydrolase
MCCGLKNYGAVCYGNAVLQGLASFTAVRRLAKKAKKQGDREDLKLVRVFAELILRLRSPSQSAISAKPLISALTERYPQFRPRELHDSHEFLTCLLASLHDLLKVPHSLPLDLPKELLSGQKNWVEFLAKQESGIAKALYGMIQTTVSCPCGHYECTYQEFSTLELPLTVYVETEQVEVRFFPVESKSILLHVAIQRKITVSDLAASLAGMEEMGQTVMIAYERGPELMIPSEDLVLRKHIAAKVPLIAYARPKGYSAVYYEVRIVLKSEEVAIPRVVFVREGMTLVEVHRAVYQALRVYYNKDEEFKPPNGDSTNGYDLYYVHTSPIMECLLCGREGGSCPLPYSGADAMGFIRQFGPKVRLEVRWHHKQSRIDLKKLDKVKCVLTRKIMNTVSLSSCLSSMLADESLDADNRWTCPTCFKQVTAGIHLSLVHAPNALILHIKRFNASGTTLRKLVDKVQFPIDLVLNLQSDQAERPVNKTYSLCSVIIHQGATLESGHFCAVSRVGSHWLLLDDCKVTEITEEEVLGVEAYLLLYECVEGQEE